MSVTDIKKIQSRLIDLRTELESGSATAMDSSRVVELDQSKVGRLSRMDALQAQAMSLAADQRRRVMLNDIEAALVRLEKGEYGLCASCSEPIAAKRLEFNPTAVLCIGCASAAEQ